jgi:hypothetical protein
MTGGSSSFHIGAIEVPLADSVVAPAPLRVAGWALGPDGPLTEALVLVDGGSATSAHLGWPRPDIPERHPEVPNAGRAGWEAKADLRAAPGPTARLSLLAPLPGGWAEVDHTEIRLDESARGTGRRARAVFTIVQNEPRFLPLWQGTTAGTSSLRTSTCLTTTAPMAARADSTR